MIRCTFASRCAALLALAGCTGTLAPSVAPAPAVVAVRDSTQPATTATPRPAPAPAGSLQQFVDSLVALPQFASMHWGVLVVAPERADTLASVQADALVMPASNMKLVTAAVALSQLGADFRWRTTVTRTGPIVRGVLRGDLVVEGRGDPSVSVAMLGDPLLAFAPVVNALQAAGVTRITGRIRASETHAFPGSPHGFGWDWDDLHEAYGAGVAELMFNEAFTDVHVRGCRAPGRAACITTTPLGRAPVVRAQVTVRAAGSGAPELQWWRDSARVPGIVVRGSIAAGDSTAFSAAHPDDRAVYIAALGEALDRAGITVRDGDVRAAGSDTVAVLQSAPLRSVLSAMQKPSQNQVAEALFRTVALERTGVGSPDSARAVVERQLLQWGVRNDAHAIRDGSGLSRHDYLTPRAVVQVLEAMRRSAGTFGAYYDALPIAGLDGTLRTRMQSFAQGRVRAKTGTIDKARALSGYVTTVDGELLLFSIIANNHTTPNREVDRVAELIVERLVAVRRVTP
ncbi:MAG TPA: D-alanyl-D-alanine carboxypeptidase/D-alanyl-D-alanine-endopeptidase [Gemmatimonadaceae bacterium]|nr:D-alanyl-D-alanine carboxypeptidase/D-alanyl-D-alanine-endopeptidase [Gemmatimonadaceae bacterium]